MYPITKQLYSKHVKEIQLVHAVSNIHVIKKIETHFIIFRFLSISLLWHSYFIMFILIVHVWICYEPIDRMKYLLLKAVWCVDRWSFHYDLLYLSYLCEVFCNKKRNPFLQTVLKKLSNIYIFFCLLVAFITRLSHTFCSFGT